jgi:Protein of unknown function (DUF3108)
MWRILAAMLGVAALAPSAPAQPRAPKRGPAPQKKEAAVPFRVGETLTYDVAWSSYLVAGTAVCTVLEKKPSYGSTAYYIVAEGRPLPLIARLYALYYKMDTLMETVTTLSQRSSLYTEEGKRHRTATTRFDRTSRRALFELQADGTARDEFSIPPEVQDGLAALYALRTRTFKAGERLTIPVADDGVLYSLNVEVTGPERLKMRLGQFDAWKLQMTVLDPARQQVGKNMAIWMSTDSRRLPLRMQADLPVGYFALALKEAH